MILSVDPQRALPVYEQVREQIRRMVAAGTLAPGTRLPTIRQLASDLGLAKGTIERAYELLETDAVLERHGRNGTFVSETATASRQEITVGLEAAAEQLVIAARQLGADEAATVAALRAAWRALTSAGGDRHASSSTASPTPSRPSSPPPPCSPQATSTPGHANSNTASPTPSRPSSPPPPCSPQATSTPGHANSNTASPTPSRPSSPPPPRSPQATSTPDHASSSTA